MLKHVVHSSLSLSTHSLTLFISDGCKTMAFKVKIEGKALKSHVFQTTKSGSQGFCRVLCYLNDRCLSYNYGTSAHGEKDMCELSESDHVMHGEDLTDRSDTVYMRAEVRLQTTILHRQRKGTKTNRKKPDSGLLRLMICNTIPKRQETRDTDLLRPCWRYLLLNSPNMVCMAKNCHLKDEKFRFSKCIKKSCYEVQTNLHL